MSISSRTRSHDSSCQPDLTGGMSPHSHTILLVGPSGVGKSTACIRLSTGEFTRNHTPSSPTQSWKLTFHLKGRNGIFTENVNVLERKSIDSFQGEDAVLFMSDRENFSSVMAEYVDFLQRVPSLFMLCKVDMKSNATYEIPFSIVRVSYKSNYNFEVPWISLFRRIYKDPTIVICSPESPPVGADFCE